MRARVTIIVVALVMAMVAFSWAQDNKATVGMGNLVSFKPGDTIVFNVSLDEPLPKGAHLDLRISPVSTNGEIQLGQGKMVDAKTFRVSYQLPEDAVPGDWHIARILLFLSSSNWILLDTKGPNFKVEGKSYKIPTTADFTIEH